MCLDMRCAGKQYIIVILLACNFTLFTPCGITPDGVIAAEESIAVQNYLELERLHMGWSEDFFGKGPYYRRVLYNFLVDKLGQEILTDYNYALISPESIYRRQVRCKLYYGKWLRIIGNIEIESIREIIGDDITVLKRWWRSRRLLAVQGRIKRFRIVSDGSNKSVVLFLDRIRLKEL